VPNGIHLIAVQSADGSLVVGDSHHYAPTPHPFGSTAVDRPDPRRDWTQALALARYAR
jgi:hypothetical protein